MENEAKLYSWSEMLEETGIYKPSHAGYETIRMVVEVQDLGHGYSEPKTFHILQLWQGRWLICNLAIRHGWQSAKYYKTNEEIKLVEHSRS